MDNGKISVRYARALLHTAMQEQCADEVYAGLVRLTDNYQLAINDFNEALSNPMVGDDDKVKLLMTAIGEPVHPCLEHFLHFTATKKRINKMFLIALKYQEMYRKENHILRADITSAVAMDEPTATRMQRFLEETFGCVIEMRPSIDPALIGGFTIDLENDRMDASISGRLKKVREELGVKS